MATLHPLDISLKPSPCGKNLIISEIRLDGAGFQLGLRDGDILSEINGNSVLIDEPAEALSKFDNTQRPFPATFKLVESQIPHSDLDSRQNVRAFLDSKATQMIALVQAVMR